MYKLLKFLICIIVLYIPAQSCSYNAITYAMPNGRLGNKLQAAINAYYLAWKYNIEFLFQPFPGSERFAIHHKTKWLMNNQYPFTRSTTFDSLQELEQLLQKQQSLLFYTRLIYPCFDEELFLAPEEFKKQARQMLQLTHTTPLITPPPGSFSIAVHIRRGGGHDHPILSAQIYKGTFKSLISKKPEGFFMRLKQRILKWLHIKQYYSDVEWPLRFVPLQYYIDQLSIVLNLYPDTPIYAFIFTDDQKPPAIKRIFEQVFAGKNITFDCKAVSGPNHEPIKDIYSMAYFDCLIRPYSTYSIISQLLGQHKLVFYPKETVWEGKILKVTEVGMISDQNTLAILKY